MDDGTDTMKQELDFVNEGKNAERCARDLERYPFIYVSKIHWDYTNKRVLVMEFVEGIKINDVDELKRKRFSLKDIDSKLFEAFGHQIFDTGFVHADPHPGNSLVHAGETLPLISKDFMTLNQCYLDFFKYIGTACI